MENTMTTAEQQEFRTLLQRMAPDQLEDIKTILANLDKPQYREIRARAIAETNAGALHRDSLHEYAQEIRAAG